MNDLKIDFNIEEVFNEIQSKINEIESNLQKLYESSVIDEVFWNTKEYETYNVEYLTYLKKSSNIYPLHLRNYLEFMKNAIDKYKYLDLNNKKES